MKRSSAMLTLMDAGERRNPWITRARVSVISEFDSAQVSEAMVNSTSPTL